VKGTADYQQLILQNFGPLNAYEYDTKNEVGSTQYAPVRISNLANFLSKLRASGILVYILSTSWYPVTAEQWKNYILLTMEVATLGFDADHIMALPVAVPGAGADKGEAIRTKLAELQLTKEQCIFTDDSSGNIKSAQGVCNTIWLKQRRGLDESDLFYLMQPIMQQSSGQGLSGGAQGGIAVGVVAALALGILVGVGLQAQRSAASDTELGKC